MTLPPNATLPVGTADTAAAGLAPVARLAPSPTGALHLGNARSFLAAWLIARLTGARLALRIEDLDGPRIKPWAVDQARADLTYLGLDWDTESPRQTARTDRYAAVLQALWRRGCLYPCVCSRKEVAAAASAPHAGEMGLPYPGTCRLQGPLPSDPPWLAHEPSGEAAVGAPAPPMALRLKLPTPAPVIAFTDRFAGPQQFDLGQLTGDFVVAKSAAVPAYQLAVVIDDADDGVTQVVRGDDLLPSTALQLHLQTLLGLSAPAYYHLPLVVGPDGRRLAKRHGDTRLSFFRERGISGAQVVGFLAQHSGWLDRPAALSAAELLTHLQTGARAENPVGGLLAQLPRQPWVVTPAQIETALGVRP